MSAKVWERGDLPAALLVVAPHPDDEVLGCGRLMRRVTAQGGRVVVAWMTDGGASHGELDPAPRAELVSRRQKEALAGLTELDVVPAETCFFGFPDGGLAGVESLGPVRRLQALCDAHGIDTVAVTDAHDGHADHRAAFAIACRLRVQRLFSYPVSARYDGEAYEAPLGAFVIVAEAGDDKRAALERHGSQHSAGGARFPLSASTIARFCADPEIFIPVARPAA